MHFALLVLALQQQPDSALRGVRDPAFGPDGRLVVSIDGDLFVQAAGGGAWSRLTSGSAWDREPTWAKDGSAIIFSSDRSGNFDLWRIAVPAQPANGAATGATPERLTTSDEPEREPSSTPDGRVIFVRGQGDAARLWVRARDGAERRLTQGQAAERSPAVSPDGARVAYVASSEAARRLRVRALSGDSAQVVDSVVVADRDAERPAWAPNGDRLAFATGGARPGVFVTPIDGRWVNLVSSRRGAPAWAPDGRTIVMAELANDPPGYNGDPARVADREVSEDLAATGRLWTVPAPPSPDDGLTERRVTAARPRAERNAVTFDRVWTRSADLYFASPEAAARRQQWAAIRDRYRPRAIAAPTDEALGDVIHAMLRERPPLRDAATGRAAVSSAHPVATAAGLEILRKGGNVVDAAVAVSFALGVVEPDASGIGGYGQMLIQTPARERPALIEFMSRVPEDASLANASALMTDGRYPSDGPVLANVPGTVAGMHTAWKRFGSGKVPWADLIAPAIRAAKEGFIVNDGLATTLSVEREHFAKYESSRALFFRNGAPLRAGDTLRNPDLAWTLEQVAKNGAEGFYRGEVARRMIADLRGKGNAMRLTDLLRYYAADREPVSSTFRGYTIYSSAPPVSGGAVLAAQLNLLEQWKAPKLYTEDAGTAHAMIAAWQLMPTTRNRIADPGLWPVNVEPIISKDTARVRWRCFDPGRSLAPTVFRGDTLTCASERKATTEGADPDGGASSELSIDMSRACGPAWEHAREAVGCHASGTTAFAVADGEGNVVAVTQTLGTWGGNFYVSPGLGFLYNDKLTSYGTDPNQYGARLPYARHGSTLAPTIVFQGTGSARRPVFAVGAAGNAWITSTVYQTLVGVLDFGLSPQQALELPRFLPGGRGAGARREFVVDIEGGFAPATLRRLREMGYTLNVISLDGEPRMGYGAAISLGRGTVTAGADPRRSGSAGAIP